MGPQQLFCSPSHAAKILGVSRKTVDRMVAKGLLTKHHIPGFSAVLLSVEQVQGIVRQQTPPTGETPAA